MNELKGAGEEITKANISNDRAQKKTTRSVNLYPISDRIWRRDADEEPRISLRAEEAAMVQFQSSPRLAAVSKMPGKKEEQRKPEGERTDWFRGP